MHTSLQSIWKANSPSAIGPTSYSVLPFEHLNLRRNPFGELDLAERATLAVVDVDRYVGRLNRPGYAVQFTGDKGRGKTTHLLALRERFPQSAYVHVEEDERPRIPQGRPLLIDEAQRVGRRQRRRVFRRGVPLVLGTHEDLRLELLRAGYEVDSVDLGDTLDTRRLLELLNRRIDRSRRSAGPVPRITPRTAEAMIVRFGDNVRAIEWHLYEVFQHLTRIQDV